MPANPDFRDLFAAFSATRVRYLLELSQREEQPGSHVHRDEARFVDLFDKTDFRSALKKGKAAPRPTPDHS